MKRTAVLVLALANLVFPAPAQAQTGFLCGFVSEFDPTLEGDTQSGEMDGGPLFSADTDNPGEEAASISMTCTLQVGSQGATHAGADALARTSPVGTGVTVLAPQVISYVAPFGTPVYLCTQASVNGVTRYYDADDEANPTDFVGWTTSSSADCGLALYQDSGAFGRCSVSDPRLLCRTDSGQLCLIWSGGTCLVDDGGGGGGPTLSPSGALCGLSSSNAVAAGATQVGEVEGGPLTTGASSSSIRIVCSVQVAAQYASAPDAATATSSTGSGSAVLPPQAVAFTATGQPVYVCSAVVVDGSPFHYDYSSGRWITDASSAKCWQAISQTVDPTPLVRGNDERTTYSSPPWMVGCADTHSGVVCA